MVRQYRQSIDESEKSTAQAPTMRERISIQEALDDLATPRCPLCRGALVARQSRRGPAFFCACFDAARKRAG